MRVAKFALLAGGTLLTAYQAYQQQNARRAVVFSAVVGLATSVALQIFSAATLKEKGGKKTIKTVVLKDLTTIVPGFIIPISLAYGIFKKAIDFINNHSFGVIQVDPKLMVRGREVTIEPIYPILAGVSFGLMLGQSLRKIYSHYGFLGI